MNFGGAESKLIVLLSAHGISDSKNAGFGFDSSTRTKPIGEIKLFCGRSIVFYFFFFLFRTKV